MRPVRGTSCGATLRSVDAAALLRGLSAHQRTGPAPVALGAEELHPLYLVLFFHVIPSEASLGPPRRTRSVARGGFYRLGSYAKNLPGLRARHVSPCLGGGMPARPLTPERPRPHTPRFAPPGRPGGLLRRQRAWGRARCQGPLGGFAGGLVRSAGPGIAFHPQTQSRPAPARGQS